MNVVKFVHDGMVLMSFIWCFSLGYGVCKILTYGVMGSPWTCWGGFIVCFGYSRFCRTLT